jgi:hypothetical protein
MDGESELCEKKAKLTALREEAARIVATTSFHGRTLTNEEDLHVLELMSRVRALERIHRRTKGCSAGYHRRDVLSFC